MPVVRSQPSGAIRARAVKRVLRSVLLGVLFFALFNFATVYLAPIKSDAFVHEALAADHIIYVDADVAGGAQDGSSWANAFSDLQDALAVAENGDEIWVAAGIYTPDAATDRSATFHLQSGVGIYGGFAGDETARDQRDWHAHRTVLSGDLEGNDITDPNGVVTNTNTIQGENSYHVVTGSGTNSTAVLDGVTITAGWAPALPNFNGAGMYSLSGSPTLTHVIIRGNRAESGGGIYNQNGSPTLTDVTIQDNRATSTYGGGIYNASGDFVMRDSTIINNRASNYGGGIYNAGSSPILFNVTIVGNRANLGGGMLNTGISFVGGTAVSRPILTNVTVSGNAANSGGGIYNFSNGAPTLQNSIVWHNQDSSGVGTADASILNDVATMTTTYSLVQGQNPSGAGNLDGTDAGNDPLFVVAPDPSLALRVTADLRLQSGSPALNVGDNAADLDGPGAGADTISDIPTDLAGVTRIAEGVVDLGAFELVTVDLQIAKHVTAPLPAPGHPVTVTLTFTNSTAAITATGVVVADLIDTDFITALQTTTDLSVTPIGAAPYTWAVGDLAPGEVGVIHVTGLISPTVQAGFTLTNTATITGDLSPDPAQGIAVAVLEVPDYTVDINTTGQGSVTRSPDQPVYFLGQTVTFTATASADWTFDQWGGDLSGSTNPQTVTIEGDMVVNATFTENDSDEVVPRLYAPGILND